MTAPTPTSVKWFLLALALLAGSMAKSDVSSGPNYPPGDMRSISGTCVWPELSETPEIRLMESSIQTYLVEGWQLSSVNVTTIDNCMYSFTMGNAINDADQSSRRDQFEQALAAARQLDQQNNVLTFNAFDCSPTSTKEATEGVIARIAAGYRFVNQVKLNNKCLGIFVLDPF